MFYRYMVFIFLFFTVIFQISKYCAYVAPQFSTALPENKEFELICVSKYERNYIIERPYVVENKTYSCYIFYVKCNNLIVECIAYPSSTLIIKNLGCQPFMRVTRGKMPFNRKRYYIVIYS